MTCRKQTVSVDELNSMRNKPESVRAGVSHSAEPRFPENRPENCP